MARKPDWLTALEALRTGSQKMRSQGRTYLVTKSSFAEGGSLKIVAQELGGKDYISGNVYYLNDGARLFPCEMSRDKVTEFLSGLEPLG